VASIAKTPKKPEKIQPELLVLIDHGFGRIGGQPAKKERI
jgi:hypothetical protein